MEYVDGEVVFSNLTSHDNYGKFSIVVTLGEEATKKLEGEGVKVKDYEGKKQRAFKTKFDFQYVDADKKKQEGELGRGSKVTVAYKLGEPYAEYGVTTYLQGIKVVECVSPSVKGDVFEVDATEIDNSDIPF
jgi:hypothetical protein